MKSWYATLLLSACATAGCARPAEREPAAALQPSNPPLATGAAAAAEPQEVPKAARVISDVNVVEVRVTNPLAESRPAETVALRMEELRKFWLEPTKTVVLDGAGNVLDSQLLDVNGDDAIDELVFQSDFGANETKLFSLRLAVRPSPARERYKVYGRFVRERHDDFAWENDRFARRAYGPALEVFEREPLTSSGIDAWVKRVPKLVVNDWYMTNDYHRDHGEGGDFYSVGRTRGCGGLGVWHEGKLHVSRNFTTSKVYANGPVRLAFELAYAPWAAAGAMVAETKRVTLDAGTSFERVESTIRAQGRSAALRVAVGIAKHTGSIVEHDAKTGWLRTWEPFKQPNGNLGCAVLFPPQPGLEYIETESDYLLIANATPGKPVVYYTGVGWDKGGLFPDAAAWTQEVQRAARRVAAPAEVTLLPAAGAKPWGARMCDAEMQRHPGVLTDAWNYDTGMVLQACEKVGQKTRAPAYIDYVKRTIAGLVRPDGTIKEYRVDDYNIDDVNPGKVLFRLLANATDPAEKQRYTTALKLLRSQMLTHPRNKDGGFWHKKLYPHQMWLDGLYMASPFLAEYAVVFGEPALFDEVVKQLVLVERYTRDRKTGLLYHGYDESRQQRWANPKTGQSPAFWGRAMGWYAMALVDTLEFLPQNHPGRPAVLAILDRLMTALVAFQDKEKGVWWQVVDAPKREKNYHEASASSMFVYALSKGINNGWLAGERFAAAAERGWTGVLKEFIDLDPTGALNLVKVNKVAGLGVGPGGGPHRDGTFAYYTSDLSPMVINDPKGVGAFILASTEREP